MEPMTVGEVAERLNAVEPGFPAANIARQVRTFVQRRLLVPVAYRGTGRTRAALFGEEQLCRARIFSVLQRQGLQPDELRHVDYYLGCAHWQGYGDPPEAFGDGFRGILNLIRGGERWLLVLHLMSQPDAKDQERRAAFFGGFARKPAFAGYAGGALSTTTLDCKALLGPLLAPEEPPRPPPHPDAAKIQAFAEDFWRKRREAEAAAAADDDPATLEGAPDREG